jgi:enamine deaminase RidA (YjgF/YER057c/UK114 family)
MAPKVPKAEFSSYAGYGDYASDHLHMSQVVRIGNEVRVSGQGEKLHAKDVEAKAYTTSSGGWRKDMTIPDSIDEQIFQALKNIEMALEYAGIKWYALDHVISLRSYHVGLDDTHAVLMGRHLKGLFPRQKPTWSIVGVERLRVQGMKVEIEAVAWVTGVPECRNA